jgi:hypothetical protein
MVDTHIVLAGGLGSTAGGKWIHGGNRCGERLFGRGLGVLRACVGVVVRLVVSAGVTMGRAIGTVSTLLMPLKVKGSPDTALLDSRAASAWCAVSKLVMPHVRGKSLEVSQRLARLFLQWGAKIGL